MVLVTILILLSGIGMVPALNLVSVPAHFDYWVMLTLVPAAYACRIRPASMASVPVSSKEKVRRRRRHVGPNQGLESSFCCRTMAKARVKEVCLFTDTGISMSFWLQLVYSNSKIGDLVTTSKQHKHMISLVLIRAFTFEFDVQKHLII